ncbi:MAG: xanthine dehydrogenase family protein molybdopterin-binding subunit, partial [Pseudonocardia sp.]|nr:xanthine dehydrogenase family protein molybdopterin-binding subunit [Pseudonocardia sp.]
MTRTGIRGVRRVDGPAKLTGAARYAADVPSNDALVAVLVTATVPTGRLAGLDTAEASAAPGVARVLGPGDLPSFAPVPSPPVGHEVVGLQEDIVYEGQPIAIVLADTLERAQHAAR